MANIPLGKPAYHLASQSCFLIYKIKTITSLMFTCAVSMVTIFLNLVCLSNWSLVSVNNMCLYTYMPRWVKNAYMYACTCWE